MANDSNIFDSWTKGSDVFLSWKERYNEELKQQIVDKPNDGAISIGEVQTKNGKFFFVTEEGTYPLESIDQIKKIATKALLKKKSEPSLEESSKYGINFVGPIHKAKKPVKKV